MSTLHLICVALWGGIVLAEVVVEVFGYLKEETQTVAQLHYWIDVLFELPLIAAVLVTGALLTAQAWPPQPLLTAKIGAGLIAISINLYCAVFVVLRHRHLQDAHRALAYRRHVMLSVAGGPFAAVAAFLGLAYFL
jgi:hypothetical protein